MPVYVKIRKMIKCVRKPPSWGVKTCATLFLHPQLLTTKSAKVNLKLFNLNKRPVEQKKVQVELCCCTTLADKQLKL